MMRITEQSTFNALLKVSKTIGLASLASISLVLPTQAASVTFDAVITAGGTETAMTSSSAKGSLPGIGNFKGCALGGNCARPSKNIDGDIYVPSDYANCLIDTSKGNKSPGLSVHISSMNSPGGTPYQTYSFDTSTRKFHYGVTVTALRRQGAWYEANYEFHLKCPSTVSWSASQTKSITLDSKNGYSWVADYDGQVGSGSGFPGSAVINNNLFKVKIVNPDPVKAAITAGMFATSPQQNTPGPKLFAYYQPTHVPTPVIKKISTGNSLNHGGGVSVADINGNGIDDILLASYEDLPENNDFTYQIGWDIDSAGTPKSWSPIKRFAGMGWSANAASVALYRAPVANAPLEAVFMAYDTANQFRYKYGTINTNGDFSEKGVFILPGIDPQIKGGGIELYDINNDNRPEIILSAAGVSSGGLTYRIGWTVNAATGNVATWSANNTAKPETYFDNFTGGGNALAKLDRNPAPEIVFSVFNKLDLQAYTITGWNIQPNGVPLAWGQLEPTGIYFPDATADFDLAIIDMDVAGQTYPRGFLPLEKSILLAGTEVVSGVDSVNYSVIRHSNSRDLVVDGNFDNNAYDWDSWSVDEDYEQSMLCATGGNLTGSPANAGLGTLSPIPLENGKSYKVQFDLWSATTGNIAVQLGHRNNSQVYTQYLNLAVNPGWNRYQIPAFTMNSSTDYDAKLGFLIGSAAAPEKVCIDNVRAYNDINVTNDFATFTGDTPQDLVKNGDFDFGTQAGWVVKSYAIRGAPTSSLIKNNQLCLKSPIEYTWSHEGLAQNNLPIQLGKTYDISFEASGTASDGATNPSIIVKVGKDSEPYTSYFESGLVTLSDRSKTFNFSFTMTKSTDLNAGFAIFTGSNQKDTDICLDKISLKERP